MKKYTNTLLIILFPVILLSLYAILISGVSLNFNDMDNTTILNSIYILFFMFAVGAYINNFLVNKAVVNKFFVIISILATLLFIFPRFLLVYIPFIYNGTVNNYEAISTLALIIITIDILILLKK